ncbi:hypothetical protein PC113_g1522 [Phytophthora cactorum]|uniref:Uncharacterized protein n=1 Tax=Phytophthora cactorum TaxID=29920 RepID=A0A8T1ERD0_9STRA|nr:hypothetical protein PC112_g1777 [Phytophthora cactorum]KAG2867935.1 hypothetical protein PC113_g1522 [Phytophthora cactorum]KAG2941288.1 hypothetical protein PC115_g2059 [Phytophthora cactorum]KAG2954136.1 hypothetical protein PC117_g1421 [Phytophthora cactorum]KAG3099797.1 hypothetical protein PC121_g1808 [Phytophthora cactorum]
MGGKQTLPIGDLLQLSPVAGSPRTFATSPCTCQCTEILDDQRWGRISDTQLNRLNTWVQNCNEENDLHQQ